MFELKEPKKTFRPDGTLSFEFIELPDGTKVSITYDKTGTKIIEKREVPPYTERISKDGKCISRYREDGTLCLVRQCDENGQWKITEYDKTGTRPLCTVFDSPVQDPDKDLPTATIVRSSKKRHKNHIVSIQKQRGE